MRHLLQRGPRAAIADPAGHAGTPAGSTRYTLDPGHTEVFASWNHFGFSNPGAIFCGASGTLDYDPARPEAATVAVTIPVAGLHTTVPLQDEHLRSAEFFDAAKFPEIRFASTRVERGATAGKLKVTGDLAVHGTTRPVTLDVTLNKAGFHELYQAQAIGFDARAAVDRSAFGMGAHVPAVSDRVELRITAEAVESRGWETFLRNRAG